MIKCPVSRKLSDIKNIWPGVKIQPNRPCSRNETKIAAKFTRMKEEHPLKAGNYTMMA